MAGGKILVVDDEKIVWKTFINELVPASFKVEGVLSGEDALEKIKTTAYDIIFIDYHLPTMNGVELCSAIKKVAPQSVAIFLTGKVEKDTIKKELQFKEAGGEILFLYKPFLDGELLKIVKTVLKKSV